MFPTAKEIGRDHQFIAYDDGTVLDTNTNLMWAANDNGAAINWSRAKSYCSYYRGGGYADWRLPTQDELESLYLCKNRKEGENHLEHWGCHLTKFISLNYPLVWALEFRGSNATYCFRFRCSGRNWQRWSYNNHYRVLPVRFGK